MLDAINNGKDSWKAKVGVIRLWDAINLNNNELISLDMILLDEQGTMIHAKVIKHIDAEHPSIIPMDSTATHPTPQGPMTRARARALETEVTSLLSQFPFDSHETWLLPQTETLCILRYQGVHREEARKQGEPEAEDMHEDGEEKAPRTRVAGRSGRRPGRSGQSPDDPDPGPDDPAKSTEDYRSLPPEAGSSGPRPGSSRPCSDVRTASRTSGPAPPPAESSDHPGLHPDHPDQPGSSGSGPGSSGQRLCACVGLSPCTPLPLAYK